jgi:gluconolactonase
MALTLDPRRTAVLAMDFQYDILEETPGAQGRPLLGTVARVLDAARRRGVTVIHVTVSFRDDYADAPPHVPLFQEERARGVMKAGSPGAEVCAELTPQAGDLVVTKHTMDPFNGTPLANLLRARDIETLVLMGVQTNFVVEATARTGADSGYRVVVVGDGCASDTEDHHRFFLDTILPKIGTAATADEVIAAFGSAP